ncbi:hypothetical protein [Chlamydia sp.]|uniref:hypothetical protein n=1 Tax=Chlamydia sp. TaxID=35827 RepID=UPI0025C52675|nr:hypothetical protein [Chlamydia sp.]
MNAVTCSLSNTEENCDSSRSLSSPSPTSSKKRGSTSSPTPSNSGIHTFSAWGPHDPFFTVPIYPQQLASMQNNLFALQTEVSSLKRRLIQSHQSRGPLGLGPLFLAACLGAVSIFAIAIIVLASLGLSGVLPFILICLSGATNTIWAIVSASITLLICCISIASIFLTKCEKMIPCVNTQVK